MRLRVIKTRTYSLDRCPCLTSLELEGELQLVRGTSLASGGERSEEVYKRVPFLLYSTGAPVASLHTTPWPGASNEGGDTRDFR